MKWALLALVFALACSSTPSVSIPMVSSLTLTASTTPGGTIHASFLIDNEATLSGLTCEVQLTLPDGEKQPAQTAALMTGGLPTSMEGDAMITLSIPSNAPLGTWGVAFTVEDGTDASSTLTGSFQVH
jgi:hypothetical protein